MSGLGEGFSDGALRFSPARGRIGTNYSLQYPSPFFDIAQTYLPATIKQMFRWCRYYYLVNPLINAVVSKMAEYPVTDVLLDSEDAGTKDLWAHMLMEHLRYRAFQVEIGLDYYAYGNGLVSIYFPFVKMIECRSCGFKKQAKDAEYAFRNYEFIWNCPKCGHHGPAKPYDHYVKAPRGIRLLRWNPEDIDVRYNDLNGQNQYYYEIPVPLKSDITMGKKAVIETVPQLFIEALRQKKAVVFSKDNLFHLKRPSLAGKDRGWGTPMILPVLKDTFYLQVMRKAQEAILLEHVVPLRVLFPQAGSNTSDPYCISLDSLVETRDGIKPAMEVNQGTLLKTHSGAWKKVEYAIDRPVRVGEKVYEFTIAALPAFPFSVSEEHPLLAVRRPSRFLGYDSLGEPDFIQAQDVQEGDFVCYPRRRTTWDRLEIDLHDYHPDRAYTERYLYRRLNQESAEIYEYLERKEVGRFEHGERAKFLDLHGWSEQNYLNARAAFTGQETIDRVPRYLSVTEGLAFLIGLYAAEGSPQHTGASLSLHARETSIMDRVDEILKGLGFPIGHRNFRDNSVQYDICDIFIGGLLPIVCGSGAQNKRLPRFILEAPDKIAIRAVEGVFAGDGCSIHTSTRREGLKTVSPQLAIDVRTLLLSYGLIATVQKAIPREDEISKLPYYQVNLNGSQGDELRQIFNDLSRVPGFSRCGFMRGEYVYLRVNKREEAPEVKTVRGFQIAGDKSFCVVGVATHNTSTNLLEWRDKVSLEIRKWRVDPNYIPIMPLPIGTQTIGGDGRALLLTQEMRVWSEQIVAGMGIPNELIFGGMSYSGSNVSLRMLENMFLGYLQDHLALLKWVIRSVADYLNWPMVGARFKPFKMADDLQRKAYLFQLNQAGKLSDESLLADADFDSSREDKHIRHETDRRADANRKAMVAQAEVQGEAQMIQMRWQMKAQTEQMKAQTALQLAAAQQQMASQVGAQNYTMQAQAAMQQGQPLPAPPPELTPQPQAPLQLPQDIQSPLTAQSIQPLPTTATGESLSQQVNVDVIALAQQAASYIKGLDPISRTAALAHLQRTQPDLHQTVYRLMMTANPTEGPEQSSRPLPQERAPRRGPQNALI